MNVSPCHKQLGCTEYRFSTETGANSTIVNRRNMMSTSDDQHPKPGIKASDSKMCNLKQHFNSDVSSSLLVEFMLLMLTFCTGIQDATTFPDYHCFVSNQTGNTVFLCIALILPQLNGDMFITSNIGVALGVFLGAGWLTGQLSHRIGPRKRWWLVVCNLVQAGLVLGAAGIQYRHGVATEGPHALSVLALLAFASGSQVVQSRSMSMTEISTAMATAAWVDLIIDKQLFTPQNRPRTRRVAFLLSLALGALAGAVIYKKVGSATAVAVSGGGKLLVTAMYLLARAESPKPTVSAA